jgi:phytoene dehydrogenase-like protein
MSGVADISVGPWARAWVQRSDDAEDVVARALAGTVDAVIIGGGHNGLVAGIELADAGWDVMVLEAADEPGGAVRSAEVTAPGFSTDLFSAFYPMTAASPVMTRLALEDHGLRWSHAPVVVGHATPRQPAPCLYRDVERTAAELEVAHPGDGQAWSTLQQLWERAGTPMLDALLAPFPPVRAATRLAWHARHDIGELARMLVLPVRRLGEERFGGAGGPLLLAGNALHADVTPEAAPSAVLGWLLCGLGQTVGFPVPVGGATAITASLVTLLHHAGGHLECGSPVRRISVERGRAVGVATDDGFVRARRAVIAAVDAEILYGRLLDQRSLPDGFVAGLRRFHRGGGTVKVNWALDRPMPWSDPRLDGAGTVHVADSLDELTVTAAQLAMRQVPERPFLLVGQMTTADATRSPAGTESVWAYTHVPQQPMTDAGGGGLRHPGVPLQGEDLERVVERIEARIERVAPGFRARVVGRHVQGPVELEAADASLVGGDIAGGSSQLHQQLVFRPVPGLARPETPLRRLYLGSASAHPGGSVHGACGANAARAARLHDRWRATRRPPWSGRM